MAVMIKFEYQIGEDKYKVLVTAKSMDVFAESAKQPHIRSLHGEEQVAAVLEYCKEKLVEVERFKNDQWNDGPNGEPHNVLYAGVMSRISAVAHYRDGAPCDGPRGEPAIQEYDHTGKLIRSVTLAQMQQAAKDRMSRKMAPPPL